MDEYPNSEHIDELKPDKHYNLFWFAFLKSLAKVISEKKITWEIEDTLKNGWASIPKQCKGAYKKHWLDVLKVEDNRQRFLKMMQIISDCLYYNNWLYYDKLFKEFMQTAFTYISEEAIKDGLLEEYEDIIDFLYSVIPSTCKYEYEDEFNLYRDVTDNDRETRKERSLIKRQIITDASYSNKWLFQASQGLKEIIDYMIENEGPFKHDTSNPLLNIAYWLAQQVKQKSDKVCCISGFEGSGKSSASVYIAMNVCKFLEKDFTIDNIVWDGNLLIEKVNDMERQSVLQYDEAGTDMYKRRATSKTNVNINKALMVCRTRNQIMLLCLPNFWDLDTFARDRRVQLWIHCHQYWKGSKLIRGNATVRSCLKQSEWGNKPFWKMDYKVTFPPMPPAFEKEYENAKDKAITAKVFDNGDPDKLSKTDLIINALNYNQENELRKTDQELIDQILKDKDIAISETHFYKVKNDWLKNPM